MVACPSGHSGHSVQRTRSRIRPQIVELTGSAPFRVHKIGAGDLGIRLQFRALTLPMPRKSGAAQFG